MGKPQAKTNAHQLISDWANAAHRGISDAITSSVINDVDKAKAVSTLDYVLQPLSIVAPFFLPVLVSAFKSKPIKSNVTQYKKILSSADSASEIASKADIYKELKNTRQLVSTGTAASRAKSFRNVSYNRTDVLSAARTRLDETKVKMLIEIDQKIDKEYDKNPERYKKEEIARQIFDYQYVNHTSIGGKYYAQLDETRVRLKFQVAIGSQLIGGVTKFHREHVDDSLAALQFDKINEIVLEEFYDHYPNATVVDCDLKSLSKYGGTHTAIPIKKIGNFHRRRQAGARWEFSASTFAYRISKITYLSAKNERGSVNIVWHKDTQMRPTHFGFNHHPF